MVLPVVAALALAGCSLSGGDAPARPPSPSPPATHQGTIRLAAVGDSITEADSPDFAAGQLGAESWVSYVVGDHVTLVGGWAQWGSTTAQMAAAVEPVDADVLVIMAGTNDVGPGEGHEPTVANIRDIADTVGAPEVVLSAVPPIDRAPELATGLNTALEDLAADAGWHWVATPAALREGERFADGMSSDGVHPTRRGAEVLGGRIRAAVLEAAGG
ncbi:hypothetical protein GCM10023169_38990 [Georgenia halophila]|uniref:SGNH hydrolase-type esterase domain-containing protein n=1 Tax=Georgenia halophila TaxID=620889 RepID=A0ABP8LPI5_9MICO